MTDKNDTEKSSDRANAPQQRFRHSRRLGLMRTLMINIGLIVTPLLVYFVVVIQHSSEYTDQRSLRALQEIATQVDNRLDTLKNILGFASGELKTRMESQSKDGGIGADTPLKTRVQKAFREIPRVHVWGLSFVPTCENASETCSETDTSVAAACSRLHDAASGVRLIIDKGRNPHLRMVDCDEKSLNFVIHDDELKSSMSRPVLETTFSQMIENTKALSEMPLIIVASQRGDVYAQLVRNHASDPSPPAHAEVREEPTVANLREILVAAQKHAVNELIGKDGGGSAILPKGGDAPSSEDEQAGGGKGMHDSSVETNQLGLPVALDTHIAGTPYRAYVLPYPLKVPLCMKDDKGQCTGEQSIIYLVGLRKSAVVASATGSLSPVVLLGALLALTGAGLLWPFVRHALLEPNDAVTWQQVRVLCVAFLVLTALGVLAARASELGHFMYEKMDRAIEEIANEIDSQMNKRIVTELEMLRRLEQASTNKPSPGACKDNEPKLVDLSATSAVEAFFQTDASGDVPKNSHLYNAPTALNEHKASWPCVDKAFDLSRRPYFYLLRDGHGVSKRDWGSTPILLQRLFNKPNGRKILQLAVPIGAPGSEFNGVSAVNIGTIEAISPVLPLGIGYAIFERSTGTVVFHSDDSRSLVENFYAETEHNPTLSTAADNLTTERSLFDGRYRGANTTLFYRPMTYSPWGLVVYYDSSSVSAVVAMSVVGALAATVMTLLGGLALAHAVIRMAHRRHSWLWPQWRLRNAYPTASVYLTVVSICEFQILRHVQSDMWQFGVLITAPLFVITACFSALSARTRVITAQRPRFLRHGLSLVRWSLLLHSVLLITWAIAAWTAGQYLACLVLVLALLAWVALVERSTEVSNVNPWRRDLNLWPGSAMPAAGRESYRMRYLMFAVSLAVVVSAVPALAIFDRTFEWYLSSALDLARTDTNEQWKARIEEIKEDGRAPPQSVELGPRGARELGGFGLTLVAAETFDVDGKRLFDVEPPTSCFHPPVAWPLGVWEGEMHWGQGLLERLRQQAMVLKMPARTHAGGTNARPQCGLRGTIHELLHAGGLSFVSVLWDIVAGLVVLALLMLLLNFSARHVMGISLPWSGRFGRQSAPVAGSEAASGQGASLAPRHVLLLQPSEESLEYARGRALGDIREVDAAADHLDSLKPGEGTQATWLLRRVDIAVLDETRRVALLALIEALVAEPNLRVIAIGDVSPVYRIARPHAYPGPSWPHIDDHERLRWIDLFSHFHKVYSVDDLKAVLEPTDGGAGVERAPEDPRGSDLDELIERETRALWPCLRPVRGILLDRLHSGADMTDRDVIELVALHGEVHYRKAWEYCTREERLALYHLAQGKLINMSNHRVVEHLLRRGLIVFEPEPRIKSVSLTEFILNAELPGRMEAWAAEAAEGIWQSLRVPFFVLLMLAVAWIAYSSGDAFQAVVALVATSVAVIGQALRLLGVVGISAPTKDK